MSYITSVNNLTCPECHGRGEVVGTSQVSHSTRAESTSCGTCSVSKIKTGVTWVTSKAANRGGYFRASSERKRGPDGKFINTGEKKEKAKEGKMIMAKTSGALGLGGRMIQRVGRRLSKAAKIIDILHGW